MHDLQRTDTTLRWKIGGVLGVVWGGSTNGLVYAVLVVIQNSTKTSLATTVRMKIVRGVSMHESCEKRL